MATLKHSEGQWTTNCLSETHKKPLTPKNKIFVQAENLNIKQVNIHLVTPKTGKKQKVSKVKKKHFLKDSQIHQISSTLEVSHSLISGAWEPESAQSGQEVTPEAGE